MKRKPLRRLVGLIAFLTFGFAAFTAVPAIVSASHSSPACGENLQFNGYRDNSQQGELLGVLCSVGSLEQGWDANFSDSSGAFRTTDNDAMSSWKLYNPRNETWCLRIHRDGQFGGTTQVFTLGHSSTWWGPSGGSMGTMNNQASSVQMYRRSGSSC